jgi:hypothetical protein
VGNNLFSGIFALKSGIHILSGLTQNALDTKRKKSTSYQKPVREL